MSIALLVALLFVASLSVLAEQAVDGARSDHSPALLARLVREPPVRVKPVVVAVGNYITGSIDTATYAVTEVLNGSLSTNVVVLFDGGTAPRELPKVAILLLLPFSDDAAYAPGKAAWRGVFPYTPEKWEEMKKADFEELAKNKPELQIPLSEAIHLVEQDWLEKGAGSEAVQAGKYDAIRTGFGWIICTLIPTDEQNVFIPVGLHTVTDDLLIRKSTALSNRAIVTTNGEVFYQ
ncbi:MAG: hypothetical protein KJ726_07185 [Verrucomicrobia bacterium]|nr:hypothetical protein [Verrucomicrobiota bacterium]MBU1909811.1 hypothetical protein [Verrucomicrobiota bacterium]